MVYVSKGEQLLLTGTSKRVAIQVLNSDAEPIEPASLSLTVHNLQNEVLFSEEFLPSATGTRIQSAGPGTGVYFVDWGDPAAPVSTPTQTETATERDVLFTWRVSDSGAAFVNEINVFQKVRTVCPLVASLTTDLRLRLDKALKPYNPSLADPCFVGYTDFMLIEFLLGGLQHINDYQPYPLWCDLKRYPHECHGSLLIDAAVWYGLGTQQIFAIDTDITNWCFVAGTGVTAHDGTRRAIEDVRPGDSVIDAHGAIQTVEAQWCEGEAETVQVTTWGGRKLQVTPNHRFPVWAWKRDCACGCGEPVVAGRLFKHNHHNRAPAVAAEARAVYGNMRIPAGYDPVQELPAEDIRPGDFLMVPRKFDEVDPGITEDQARLIGYYVAEGHRHPDRNFSLTFGTDEVETWVEDAKAILEAEGFGHRLDLDSRGAAVHLRTNNGITSRKPGAGNRATDFVETLDRCVSGGHAWKKTLSGAVMRWPLHLKWALLAGMFRGDGHQNWQTARGGESFSVWYNTSSRMLCDQTELILAQLGIPCRYIEEPERDHRWKDGRVTRGKGMHRLVVSGKYAKTLADRVWGSASQAGDGMSRREGWSMPRHNCMVDEDYIYVPVKSVEVAETAPVYNLTVAGSHTYLACGLATNNSDQGNSWVLDHAPKIAAAMQPLYQSLEKRIPAMKWHYVRLGSVRTEISPNYRLNAVIGAAPKGALFRNVISAT